MTWEDDLLGIDEYDHMDKHPVRTKAPVDDLDRQRIRRQADATIARAHKDIERAERKIAQLEAFGEDVYEEETVLCFYKRYQPGGIAYTYIALKANDQWYLTGPRQSGLHYHWGGLIEFIVGNNAIEDVEVWVASEWQKIV